MFFSRNAETPAGTPAPRWAKCLFVRLLADHERPFRLITTDSASSPSSPSLPHVLSLSRLLFTPFLSLPPSLSGNTTYPPQRRHSWLDLQIARKTREVSGSQSRNQEHRAAGGGKRLEVRVGSGVRRLKILVVMDALWPGVMEAQGAPPPC